MWTESKLARNMRALVRAALPPRAFLKRDTGTDLLVSNAPAFDPSLNRIPRFALRREGALLKINPDESWLNHLERARPQAPDNFSQTLLRFRNQAISPESLRLFIRAVKLTDQGRSAPESEIEAFQRALRQRAAEALRGEDGGGLYACALLLNEILNSAEVKQET